MKKLSTLTCTGAGTTALLERGKLELGKGRLMKGIRLIMRVLITNASGSSKTLSDTEAQSFLDGYRLTLSYGRSGRRKPYNSMRFTRLQRLARYMLGSEWEGYANTTSGLLRALANGATHEVKLHVVVPTGYLWQLGKEAALFGVGRTQARGMQLELKRETDTLPTGLSVSGSVTWEVVPDDVSRPGPESWWYLPEYTEKDETDKRAIMPPCAPLYFAERTAVLASSVLTDCTMYCDGEELHRGVAVADWHAQALYDIPNVPSAADLADRETPLLVVPLGTELRDVLSGVLTFEQVTKNLGTMALSLFGIPLVEEQEVAEDVQDAAGKNGRNKTLKAVNAAVALGYELPHHLYPYMPFFLLDSADKEFERYPGLVSDGSAPAELFLPLSVLERGRAQVGMHKAAGEDKQAEDVVRTVALAVPAAVQDTRGFSRRGSETLNRVRASLS